jgi:putative flippase GtrA
MVSARITHLYATFRHLIHEVARFGVVGAVAYVFTVALSNWLRYGTPGLGPLTSLGTAMIVAASFSYFANRHWTWKNKARSGVRREYGLFIALSVVGFGLTEIPLAISEYALDLHSKIAYNISGNIVGTAIGMVWRFWSFKRWVFLEPEPARTDDAAHSALV